LIEDGARGRSIFAAGVDAMILIGGNEYPDIGYWEPSVPWTRMQIGSQISKLSDELLVPTGF